MFNRIRYATIGYFTAWKLILLLLILFVFLFGECYLFRIVLADEVSDSHLECASVNVTRGISGGVINIDKVGQKWYNYLEDNKEAPTVQFEIGVSNCTSSIGKP